MALSGGDAEYNALAKAASERMGVQSIFEDLVFEAQMKQFFDSSTAKSIASRIRVGKVMHIHTRVVP